MATDIKPGRYILAVSGGVDSMALLNMLSNLPGVELVVAHFNHGIRTDSAKDEMFVKSAAARYGLEFESARGNLGKNASEEAARAARYDFLEEARRKHKAGKIITAHHQDDLIETVFINLLRGTGRRGLAAMSVNPGVARPLLGYSKAEILEYARNHRLAWREDSTNLDDFYLRNYIRHNVLSNLTAGQRGILIGNIEKVANKQKILNRQIAKLSQNIKQDGVIDRREFTALPVELGDELVLYWLRKLNARQPDRRIVRRLNVALRASKAKKTYPAGGGLNLLITTNTAEFCNSL